MNLQESINATPAGARLELPPGEFFGQVVINRPVTIVGKGSSTWIGARTSPTVKIRVPGVRLENLMIEITSGSDGIAVEADPGVNPVLDNVTIRGKVVGVHPEQMKSAEVSNEPSAEIFFEPPPPITSAGNQEQSYAATVAQSDTSPTSDLIERRVNSLLAKAEQAEDKGDWKTAADAYEDVLMLAPGRADVERLLERARNRFSKARFTFLLNRTKKPALVVVGIVIAVAVLAGIRSGINLLDRKLESQPQGQAPSQTQRPVEKTIQPAKTDQKIDAEREYELGRQFFYGWGRPIDFQEAFIHLRLAAEQGHRSAAEMLKAMGKFGYQTDGKRHDPYASTRGQAPPKTDQTVDAEEAFRLGEKYLYGRGVTRNYPKAAQYYSYAAERGHSEAMHSLGWVYEHGVGVQKDLWAAREWYRKAAELGHQNAKTALQRLSR